MAAFLEKATSALNEAKESVLATAETVTASLTDAQKTVASSAADAQKTAAASLTDAQKTVAATAETATRSVTDAGKTVAATTETVKTEAAAAPDKVSEVTTQAKSVVDNALSRGIEGLQGLLHTLEDKKTEVSDTLVGAVTNVVSGASSSTAVNRDLPVSTDNQPLLDRGVETTPWWKNCCGVLDLLKTTTPTTKDEKSKDN